MAAHTATTLSPVVHGFAGAVPVPTPDLTAETVAMLDAIPNSRRGFLRGLATLPLIGGSVAILGKPTQAAVPVTIDLMQSYQAWLHYEHRMLSYEMAGYDVRLAQGIEGCTHMNNPGADYHFRQPYTGRPLAGWPDAPQPSTRAAVMLSAVGCPLTGYAA